MIVPTRRLGGLDRSASFSSSLAFVTTLGSDAPLFGPKKDIVEGRQTRVRVRVTLSVAILALQSVQARHQIWV